MRRGRGVAAVPVPAAEAGAAGVAGLGCDPPPRWGCTS
jgi:hypothetical protein